MFLIITLLFNLTVEGRISGVVVYPDRALITRVVPLELTGETEIIIPNLSGFLDETSVKIRGENLMIGDVKVKRGYIEKPSAQVLELEKRIKETEERIRKKEDEKAVLKAKEDFLNSIKLGTPEIIGKELREGRISPAAWKEAINFLGTEYSQLKMRAIEIEREQEELNKKLSALRKELADIKALTENKKEITLRVLPKREGKTELFLEYLIPQEVFWKPTYEIYADMENKTASLSFYTKVWQRTGEDWEGVDMKISTARPTQFVSLPEPYPWYVDIMEEYPLAKEKGLLMTPSVKTERLDEMAEGVEWVRRVETGISLQYSIPKQVRLKSGEAEKRFLISQTRFPAEFEFYSFPKANELVFMKGRVFNNGEEIFLSGEANTYIGSEYTGKITIPDFTPQETLNINFGSDERVKVKRELVKVFTAKTGGLFGKREKKEFLYRITLENHRPGDIKFTLLEQYPISRSSEISVKVTRVFPERFVEDKEEGKITWEGELASGKKFTCELGFTVEYPRGKRVSGL